MAKKMIGFIKKHLNIAFRIAAIALVAMLALSAVACGGEEDTSSQGKQAWGSGLTENIPEFPSDAESYDLGNDGYAAAYYINVATEDINSYISKLESELEIDFSDERYPKTASYGEKIITIHYNVTEMRLSVTVTEKENTDNYISGE